jgi:hypothetical protein
VQVNWGVQVVRCGWLCGFRHQSARVVVVMIAHGPPHFPLQGMTRGSGDYIRKTLSASSRVASLHVTSRRFTSSAASAWGGVNCCLRWSKGSVHFHTVHLTPSIYTRECTTPGLPPVLNNGSLSPNCLSYVSGSTQAYYLAALNSHLEHVNNHTHHVEDSENVHLGHSLV